jgi:hypothetical protein
VGVADGIKSPAKPAFVLWPDLPKPAPDALHYNAFTEISEYCEVKFSEISAGAMG